MKAKKDSLVWEDILFENKNKSYGAYLLRRSYNSHLLRAAVIASVAIFLGLSLPKILAAFESDQPEVKEEILATVQYMELAPPPPIQKELMAAPPKAPDVQKVVKYVPPKVTKEEVVEEPLPTIEEIKNNQIGTVDVEGEEGLATQNPVEVADGGGGGGFGSDGVFDFVEQSPEFPGGMEALMKYLQKNMRYPARSQRMEVQGTVYVSFVVDQNGTITNVEVKKGLDQFCDEEAVRVIQKMPKWQPGKQGGQAVKVRFMMPIKFKLSS